MKRVTRFTHLLQKIGIVGVSAFLCTCRPPIGSWHDGVLRRQCPPIAPIRQMEIADEVWVVQLVNFAAVLSLAACLIVAFVSSVPIRWQRCGCRAAGARFPVRPRSYTEVSRSINGMQKLQGKSICAGQDMSA